MKGKRKPSYVPTYLLLYRSEKVDLIGSTNQNLPADVASYSQ